MANFYFKIWSVDIELARVHVHVLLMYTVIGSRYNVGIRRHSIATILNNVKIIGIKVTVQTLDPQKSDCTNLRLTHVGQCKRRTSTNAGLVQTSD